jgi:hypothetical protein
VETPELFPGSERVVNSRSHARLRRLQSDRKCAKVGRALVEYIYENNRPMMDAVIADFMFYGRSGNWSLSDDGVLSYDRAIFNTGTE